MKRQLYRCGQAAAELGVSRHIMRRLADCSLIEYTEVNGRLYFSMDEVTRLKKTGIPPLPAPIRYEAPDHPDEAPEEFIEQVHSPHTREPEMRSQGLYATPSDELARSKEDVIRLQHIAEKKRLRRAIQDEEDAAQQRRQETLTAQAIKKRNVEWQNYATSTIPEDCDTSIHRRVQQEVEGLMESLPSDYPDLTILKQVGAIVARALQPYSRAKFRAKALNDAIASQLPTSAASNSHWQQRATAAIRSEFSKLPADAEESEIRNVARNAVLPLAGEFDHLEKIKNALSRLSLSHRLTEEETQQAADAARKALLNLQVGASDQEIRLAKDRAISPFQKLGEDRQILSNHKAAIQTALMFISLPWEADSKERNEAESIVRKALEALPPGVSRIDFDETKKNALTPVIAAINRRVAEASRRKELDEEERAAQLQAESEADNAFRKLERHLIENYEYEENWHAYKDAKRIKEALLPRMIKKILAGSFDDEASMERWLHRQAEKFLEEN